MGDEPATEDATQTEEDLEAGVGFGGELSVEVKRAAK
jgi:hypothetical protein